jgi:nucleoporin SEH1
VVHDVAYDWYGTRLATCASDQRIKVWEQGGDGAWQCCAEWKAHHGSVWRVTWADAEFGALLASCSFDRTVKIWEEAADRRSWSVRATLLDSTRSVQDVQFAPRHLGLKLAAASLDGSVRVYEAVDVTNLSHWPVADEFLACDKAGLTCLAWCPAPHEPALLAVGSQAASSASPAPLPLSSSAASSSSSSSGSSGPGSSSSSSLVRVWRYDDAARKWLAWCTLRAHGSAVHALAWAPALGRAAHTLATAGKDRRVCIWRLPNTKKAPTSADAVLEASLDAGSEVWRVQWNLTGTVLATSGDDGAVRFWARDAGAAGEWREQLHVQSEHAQH